MTLLQYEQMTMLNRIRKRKYVLSKYNKYKRDECSPTSLSARWRKKKLTLITMLLHFITAILVSLLVLALKFHSYRAPSFHCNAIEFTYSIIENFSSLRRHDERRHFYDTTAAVTLIQDCWCNSTSLPLEKFVKSCSPPRISYLIYRHISTNSIENCVGHESSTCWNIYKISMLCVYTNRLLGPALFARSKRRECST